MCNDTLAPRRRLVLIAEASSVKNLLRDAATGIRSMKFAHLGVDSTFAIAAHGVEKLLKLTIGVHAIDVGETWPSVGTMIGWRHDIGRMAANVDQILNERANIPYLEHLIASQRRDPIWPLVISALTRYAAKGRFHGLDNLAGADLEEELNPSAMWQALELEAQKFVPALVSGAAYADSEKVDAAVADMRCQTARSLERWWATLAQFLIIGALGDAGKLVGGECAADDWMDVVKGHATWPA